MTSLPPTLFDNPITRETDPPSSHEAATKLIESGRRVSQKQKMLDRLRLGPATNVELVKIALNYRARISDLRLEGYVIVCEQNRDDGVTVYRLVEAKK